MSDINKYFAAAVKRYKHKVAKIHPISLEDALIVEELKKHLDKDVKVALENWKFLSDDDILSDLKELKKRQRDIDKIGGHIIEIEGVYIRLEEIRHLKVDRLNIRLIINPTTADNFNWSLQNIVLSFSTVDRLEEVVSRLVETFDITVI